MESVAMGNPFRIFVGAYAKIAGMDDAGEIILGTYLNGDGSPVSVFDDPFWNGYMMRHRNLRGQIYSQLTSAVEKLVADLECRKDSPARIPLSVRFHAEFPENSNKTGYALMHGSNRDVGDFLIVGWAEPGKRASDGSYRMNLDMSYVWNDIIDPNGNYTMDKIQSGIATVVMLGKNKSYHLHIGWRADAVVDVLPNRSPIMSGYPTDNMVNITNSPLKIPGPGWWTFV
jgi:hypothetical protein